MATPLPLLGRRSSPSQSTTLSDEQSDAQSSRRPRSRNSRASAHHAANAADNSSSSPRWNGPIGWSVYFPETMETDPACKGRADVVSMVKRAFLSDQRFRTLLTLPAYSTAFSLDFKLLSARTSPAALRKIAMALHLNPTIVLASLGLAACRAAEDLLDDTVAEVSHSTKLCVRIRNFSQLTPLRLLKGSSVGTFVAVCGTVLRVSTIRQQLISMQFRCVRCGEDQTVSFPDYNYKLPTGCPTERCRSRTFTPLHKTAVTVDWQKIRVQELQQRDQGDNEGEGMEEGRIPRTIDAELFGDLLDSCVPGDIATVCGIVKVMALNQSGGGQQHGAKGAQSLYYMYIEANSICTTRSRAGAIDAGAPAAATVHSVIHEIVREEDPFGFLVHSAVPSIFGHELVKAGLLLALFGGAPRSHKPMVSNGGAEGSDSGKDDDASGDEDSENQQNSSGNASSSITEDVKIRRNAHVLVVGDPGLGKSQMLKAFCNVAPRGVYVCGTTSSTTGLTVTVVREPSGDFALEAGALVLGDGGVCCIDEFDKMTSEHGALLEAMEQQSVSVAKAGLLCNLSARTTVLAAANPVGGNYDRSKTVCENLKMARPLLSRFDLVFILMDRADAQRDRFISEHVMRTFARRGRPQRGRSGWDRRAAGQHNSQPYMACTAAAWRGSTRAGLCADTDEDRGGRRKTAAAAAAAATTQAQAAALAGEGDKDRNQLEQQLQQMRVRDPLPPSLFREYVSYARTHVHPTLSRGSKRVLQDFYRELRKIAKDQAADTTPVTTRQLESMIRLAEARARAVMRTVVTAADARDVVEIMRKCMVVELSDDMGGIDFGRTTGMSKAAEARRFMAKLNAESKRTNKAKFSDADLKRIGDAIGLEGKKLSDVIESINCQGMLLKKGGGMWSLQM